MFTDRIGLKADRTRIERIKADKVPDWHQCEASRIALTIADLHVTEFEERSQVVG